MRVTVYTVTYVNDDVAAEFGSEVFGDEAAAAAWLDAYVDPGGHRYAVLSKHQVDVDQVDVAARRRKRVL